jgi:uncharacterized protein (UPF0333 family)
MPTAKVLVSHFILMLVMVIFGEVAFLTYIKNEKNSTAIIPPQAKCTTEVLNVEKSLDSISSLSTFQQGNLEYVQVGLIKSIALTQSRIWQITLTDGKEVTFPFATHENLISLSDKNNKNVKMIDLKINDKIRAQLSFDLKTKKTSVHLELLP